MCPEQVHEGATVWLFRRLMTGPVLATLRTWLNFSVNDTKTDEDVILSRAVVLSQLLRRYRNEVIIGKVDIGNHQLETRVINAVGFLRYFTGLNTTLWPRIQQRKSAQVLLGGLPPQPQKPRCAASRRIIVKSPLKTWCIRFSRFWIYGDSFGKPSTIKDIGLTLSTETLELRKIK